MEKEIKNLGHKIKKLRELRNFSQEYMADQLGLSQSAYSKLETDQTELTYNRLSKIADALQLSVSDIIHFDEKVILNVTNNDHAAGGNYHQHNYYNDKKVIELLESQVRLLEDKVKHLEEQLRVVEGK